VIARKEKQDAIQGIKDNIKEWTWHMQSIEAGDRAVGPNQPSIETIKACIKRLTDEMQAAKQEMAEM
jgi:hypothetical protein